MSMKRTILTWGLISGVISITLMIGMMQFIDRIGFDRGEIFGYTVLVLSSLLIFFGVRSFRDNVAGGKLSFGKGFLVGLGIALVSAVCYVVVWEVVYFNFMPDFADNYAAHMVEKAKAAGASAEKVAELTAQGVEMKRLLDNPFWNAAFTFLEPFPIGLLAALVSAGILRRKPQPA